MSEEPRDQTAAIESTLTDFLSGLLAEDLERVLGTYSDSYSDGQADKAARGEYYANLIAQGVFKNATIDTESLEIAVEGGVATLAPVTFKTIAGTASYQYQMKQEADGAWRIIGAAQVITPPSSVQQARVATAEANDVILSRGDRELLGDAGRLVDRHAMVWVRRLNAPIDQVWEKISTTEGLRQWWVAPPSKFELRRGGAFNHHWNNTVLDFKEGEFIDFAENTGDYASTGGMRFEISEVDESSTMFMFLDTWGPDTIFAQAGAGDAAEQAGGLGTPWPGVAAGWHAMVDKLEFVVDDKEPSHSIEELTEFYVGYLRDVYRWNAMVQRPSPVESQ